MTAKIRIKDFIKARESGRKLAMLTAYDAPAAELLEGAGIDMILVGDSVGMVVLGYPSTRFVTMDEMIHHAKAVRRGAKHSFIIGDLPLKGVEKGPKHALLSAKRFILEAGCDAVKLEWNRDCLETVRLLRENRIKVMGHIGLTPQTVKNKEGFRVQGREAGSALEIFRQAKALEDCGIFSLLVECVPAAVTEIITKNISVPTIGIGSGPHCDGQVLVFNDLVGAFTKFKPRFVKRYAQMHAEMKKAVEGYVDEVRHGKFPDDAHSFGMNADELGKFKGLLK